MDRKTHSHIELARYKALCDILYGADGGAAYEALTGRPLGGFIVCVISLGGKPALADALAAVAALPQCRGSAVFAAARDRIVAFAEPKGAEGAPAEGFGGILPALRRALGRETVLRVDVAQGLGAEELRCIYGGCEETAGGLQAPRETQAAPPAGKAAQPVLAKALNHIAAHYGEPITLRDVAECAFVSQCYISRLFMRELGVGFVDYLTALRMENARRLLRETEMKISEVAELCGISDPHYFAKLFRKGTGLSPSEYRAKQEL